MLKEMTGEGCTIDDTDLLHRLRQKSTGALEKSMREAARMMEYEYAAVLRDEIIRLRGEANQAK